MGTLLLLIFWPSSHAYCAYVLKQVNQDRYFFHVFLPFPFPGFIQMECTEITIGPPATPTVGKSDFAYSPQVLLLFFFPLTFKGIRLTALCLKLCLLNFMLEWVRVGEQTCAWCFSLSLCALLAAPCSYLEHLTQLEVAGASCTCLARYVGQVFLENADRSLPAFDQLTSRTEARVILLSLQ